MRLNLSVILLLASTAHGLAQIRIADLAAKAKREGRSTVDGPSIAPGHFPLALSLEKALHHGEYPLLVQIDKRVSAVDPDGERIHTWYEARILDNPGNRPLPDFGSADADLLLPPKELEPLPSDSITLRTAGGSVVINGVTVISRQEPVFVVGDQYFVIVRFDDNRDGTLTRQGKAAFGPSSVFLYDAERHELSAGKIDATTNAALLNDILGRSRGSYEALKQVIQSAQPSAQK